MKVLAVSQHGPPSNYTYLDVPQPQAAELGADEVLIEVHAASLNPVDVKIANGNAKLVLDVRYAWPRSKRTPSHFANRQHIASRSSWVSMSRA
jgi:NADPH:quinone reductase-like Zn-dependent oxidoreductase